MSHRPVKVIYKERSEIEKVGCDDRRVYAAGRCFGVAAPLAVPWTEARVEGVARNRNGGIGGDRSRSVKWVTGKL